METGFTASYGEGWWLREDGATRAFRWSKAVGRVSLALPAPVPAAWLRLLCGVMGGATPPLLSITVNGREAGRARVSGHLGYVSFPLGAGRDFDVQLAPDRTFTAPGDPRTLGVAVAGLEVFDEDRLAAPLELEGWFEREDHEYFPFSWMGREAALLLPAASGARFASLPVCAESDEGEQVLAVACDGQEVAQLPLRRGWRIYDVALAGDGPPTAAPRTLTLRLNAMCPPAARPGDARDLGVRVGPLELHADARRHAYVRGFDRGAGSDAPGRDTPPPAAVDDPKAAWHGLPAVGDGWHLEEREDRRPFRWTRRHAVLRIAAGVRGTRRFCSVPVFSAYRNLAQQLTVGAGGACLATFDLARGWHTYPVALPLAEGTDLEVTLAVNKLTPPDSHPGDSRELGVRVGEITLHDDEARHGRERFVVENAVRNARELQSGATRLQSFPQTLGIDLYGRCNIKPACVYCLWDPMKALEGEATDAVVDDSTLRGYGGLFDAARLLVNCSFGEPLLHPRLDRVLALAESEGKVLELSTNGQAFTPRTVNLLAGRRVHLYVSLDAAGAATYARLRNDRWDEVLAALLHLADARAAHGGWPRLNMVFMPMPANLDDLERYFRLCRLLRADNLVLRPLLHLDDPGIVSERGGYRFDYASELLGKDALEPVFAACERYAGQYGVQVVSQFDFGLDEAARFRQATGATEDA
jgi:MoaA/NifB/PqqE/SkfB family radical SAM enzyme